MRARLINSQMTNLSTYIMYRRQLVSLATNVFLFRNLPDLIDKRYMNNCLLMNGAVAFFYDEGLESVICLPYTNILKKDVYGRPTSIIVHGENGYQRVLKQGEFVIMYDNNSYRSIYADILQYAERLGLCERVCDVNISQQKTPRLWRTNSNQLKSVEDTLNEIDGLVEKVVSYKNIDLNEIQCILQPAPFITDKIDDHMAKKWAEFYRLIGIASLIEQKKERVITDEIAVSQGGTVASRFNRYEPRLDAINEINKKWGLNIELCYYDGTPCSEEEPITQVKDLVGGEEDVSMVGNKSNILS